MHMLKGLLFCLWLASLSVAAADWYPLAVEADGRAAEYRPLPRAAQPWRICALLPHGKDRYWWGVAWGLDQEATRQGVRLGIYEAGGYENPAVQRQQLQDCREAGADAYVIAAITTDGLCPEVGRLLAARHPVVDLSNGLECPGLTAHARVDFGAMAHAAMAYIEQRSAGRAYSLGWLPGPQGAGWVMRSENGLQQALLGQPATLYHGGYAPVDRVSQARLVRSLLSSHAHLDYLLGNAEAASFAAQLVRSVSGSRPAVLATYATERIIEQIRSGAILAAPTDSPVLQARIAIDLAVRALEGKPHPQEVSSRIEMLDKRSLEHFDSSRLMPPAGQWMIRRDLPR